MYRSSRGVRGMSARPQLVEAQHRWAWPLRENQTSSKGVTAAGSGRGLSLNTHVCVK